MVSTPGTSQAGQSSSYAFVSAGRRLEGVSDSCSLLKMLAEAGFLCTAWDA